MATIWVKREMIGQALGPNLGEMLGCCFYFLFSFLWRGKKLWKYDDWNLFLIGLDESIESNIILNLSIIIILSSIKNNLTIIFIIYASFFLIQLYNLGINKQYQFELGLWYKSNKTHFVVNRLDSKS